MTKSFMHLYCLVCLGLISCSCSFLNPKPDDSQNGFYSPAVVGPNQYRIETDSVFPSYMSDVKLLTIRTPLSESLKPLPVIIVEPGFFSASSELEDVENRYASHGFLVIGVTNTAHYNLITTSLDPYKTALLQTVRYAVESCRDSSNKWFGLIDTNAIGISGHSMGGGGTIMACDSTLAEYNHYIKTAIAMNPFGKCTGQNIRIPMFLFSSDLDAVFNPFMPGVTSSPDIYYSFQTMTQCSVRLFANFKEMDHNAVVDRNLLLNTSGNANVFLPSMVSWFKVYLAGDTTYNKYLETTGTEYQVLKSRFVSHDTTPAYRYVK